MSRGRLWADEAAQAWRGLVRRPGYLLLAAFTLALGVATSTTVFSMIDQALLKPLPFERPDRLVTLGMQDASDSGDTSQNVAAPAFLGAARQMQTMSSVGMVLRQTRTTNIAWADLAEVASGLSADRGFLRTLEVQLLHGRNFSEDEDRPNGPPAAIISYDLWQRGFGGDPDVLGKRLLVEGNAVPVVGVLPRRFVWPDRFDVLLPLQPDVASTSTATNEYIVGRMRPDVSPAVASAEADAAMRPVMAAQIRSDDAGEQLARIRFNALPLQESVYASRSGKVLWMFLAASLCVLAIAAFNLGNLMFLRSLSRDHDLAVRAALGASNARLALPAFAEAALIGLLGAVGGVVLAWIGLRLLASWVPPEWLRGEAPGLGAGALAFALVAGGLVALLGAALGVLRGRRRSALASLGREGQVGLSRGAGRLARGLIVVQVGVAALLLLGASLFGLSLQKLSQMPMGFESRSIVTFTLSPVRAQTADASAVKRQTQEVIRLLEREPGADLVGASTNLPTGSQLNMYMELPDGRGVSVQYRPMTARFMEVFGIPLLTGRGFDASLDREGSEPVAVVSEAFARDYFDGDAVGRVVRVVDGDGFTAVRIVGVAGDVRQFGPAEPAPPILYAAFDQISPELWTLLRDYIPLRYAVKVRPGMEGPFAGRLHDLVRQASPNQPIADVETMRAVVAATTRDQKLNLLLIGIFSVLALLLAAVGLYAVMAVAVTARRHEFGVRAALGAPPGRLLRQVLMEGGRQVGLGLAVGLVAALATSRLLQNFLFDVDPADPAAIAIVVMVLAGAGVAACFLPAMRAARVPPMQALRMD
ncbi:ADOP family duplicated permease [Luteimonas sp. Y-2-2-4F]|nr:ADOP family duplicated permease [Luteimonas sp. Y-2-2-4F]